jgi:hypothetical protein
VNPWIKPINGGAELSIHIQPGASKSEISGLHGDAIKIRIQARPVEGAANAALTEFIATCLGVPRKGVTLVRGEKSRQKTVAVAMPALDVERQMLRFLAC